MGEMRANLSRCVGTLALIRLMAYLIGIVCSQQQDRMY